MEIGAPEWDLHPRTNCWFKITIYRSDRPTWAELMADLIRPEGRSPLCSRRPANYRARRWSNPAAPPTVIGLSRTWESYPVSLFQSCGRGDRLRRRDTRNCDQTFAQLNGDESVQERGVSRELAHFVFQEEFQYFYWRQKRKGKWKMYCIHNMLHRNSPTHWQNDHLLEDSLPESHANSGEVRPFIFQDQSWVRITIFDLDLTDHYWWSWSFKWSRSLMVILIFDLDQTFHDLDLNLLYEKIRIDAVILIFDLNFARSLALILIFRLF